MGGRRQWRQRVVGGKTVPEVRPSLQKLVAKVRSCASHNFCERDRHLFIFGKSSFPKVFFRLHFQCSPQDILKE